MEASEAEDRPSKRAKVSPTINEAEISMTEPLKNIEAVNPGLDDDFMTRRERDVGISVFVSEKQPTLYGLLKKRYTDFLVNEVMPDGKVVHLKSLKRLGAKRSDLESVEELPKEADKVTANGTEESIGSSGTYEMPPEDRTKLLSHFEATVVDQLISLYASILSDPKAPAKSHPTIRTPFTTDRSLRAQIHQDIRRIFNSKIESQTDHSGTLVLSCASPNRLSGKKPRGKLSWAERGGEHLQFSLYKENKDSMEIVNLIARLLKMNSKDIRIAGTKDRRAATTQRVSAYRVEVERLVGLNKTLRGSAVGDFEYKSRGLELGELSGNEFEIALRECSVPGQQALDLDELKKSLEESMASLHRKGFLNYYGLQRFGTFALRTDEIGLRILRGDFEGACNLILDFNRGILESNEEETGAVGRDDKARAQAIHSYRTTGRYKEALDIMPKRFAAETALLRHLGRSPTDFLGALLTIPRTQRTLYGHAYQSRVWNTAASERWRTSGDKVMAGDLVLVNEHKDKEGKQTEMDTIDTDGEVVIQASANDSSETGDDMFERARHLSAEEAGSGEYSIFDIVLPTPGWDIEYPRNQSGDFYKTFMASEEGGGLNPNEMQRKQRDFSLSGSYRKFMARIGNDFGVQVKKYIDEDETLLETDLDKIRGQQQNGTKDRMEVAPENTTNSESSGGNEKTAVILKFQLGSSQYATMALRELSRGGIREYKPEFSGGR